MALKPIKVGIIGFGMSAKVFHIPIISILPELYTLTHILQRSGEEAKEKHPHVTVVRTPEEIYSSDIDLVVITTTPDSHFSLAKNALIAGKHVVVEKPFTTTREEGEELIALAAKSPGILTIFQNRRWDGDFLTLKSLLKQNSLGRVVNIASHYDRYRPVIVNTGSRAWKETSSSAGGILFDLGSHLVDQIISLYGLPSTVHASILHQRDKNSMNNDFFVLTMDYSPTDGPLVTLQAGSLVRDGFSPRFKIEGTKGSFIKYGMDVQEGQIAVDGLSPRNPSYGLDRKENWGKIDTELEGGLHFVGNIETTRGDYPAFYKGLAEAIGKEDRDIVDVKPEQVLDALKVLEAAIESSQKNIVVRVS